MRVSRCLSSHGGRTDLLCIGENESTGSSQLGSRTLDRSPTSSPCLSAFLHSGISVHILAWYTGRMSANSVSRCNVVQTHRSTWPFSRALQLEPFALGTTKALPPIGPRWRSVIPWEFLLGVFVIVTPCSLEGRRRRPGVER